MSRIPHYGRFFNRAVTADVAGPQPVAPEIIAVTDTAVLAAAPVIDPLDLDGDGEVDRDEVRAALVARGILFDKRWGVKRLRSLLD